MHILPVAIQFFHSHSDFNSPIPRTSVFNTPLMSSTDASSYSGSTTQRPPDTWSAALYNQTASFVYSRAFTSPVLELLNPQPGERIIDVGCGSGELSLQIQHIVREGERGHGGIVVGVDSSESMVCEGRLFYSH